MSFATLQEAWGVTTFDAVKPAAAAPPPARKPFDKTAGMLKPAAVAPAKAGAVVRDLFYKGGLPALSHATGMQFVRDLVAAATTVAAANAKKTRTPSTNIDNESWLMVMIGLFSLLVILDAL
jgi:hypothetical protein